MDYQDQTQDKIITRYNSCIKAKHAHDYNHLKAAILHKEKQSGYMPCQYHLSPLGWNAPYTSLLAHHL